MSIRKGNTTLVIRNPQRKRGERGRHFLLAYASGCDGLAHEPSFPLRKLPAVIAGCFVAFVAVIASAADLDEFKIMRQAVFDFAQPPALRRKGDQLEIRFTAKAACDVAIAIEDASGRIIRHLAAGVLGPNAPEPLRKDSLRQEIIWDGKDDLGRYVDTWHDLTVRVSLGLKPRFERALFWSPKKRISRNSRPLIATSEEGVFVFEGEGVDHVRRFDHQGEYVRTVYPFPADKLSSVEGLERVAFPQDGARLPLKHGLVQATLLNSGRNIYPNGWSKYQSAASAFAVRGERIALVMDRLNRLSGDGSTGGAKLTGAETSIEIVFRGDSLLVPPRSAAFSPDGKFVYLTGYTFKPKYPRPRHWLPCVTRLTFDGDLRAEVFAGSDKIDEAGADAAHLNVPTSVATDAQGRVYVADYMNDRVQVFEPAGKLHSSIKINKPAELAVHQKTGEIYVASWNLLNRLSKPLDVKEPTLTRLGPLDDPKVRATYRLPLLAHHNKVFMNKTGGMQHGFALDSWTDPATIWLVPGAAGSVDKLLLARGQMNAPAVEACLKLLVEDGDKLVVKRDFGAEVVEDVLRAQPPIHARQKLYVNPANGKLYVFEGQAGVSKSVKDLLEIDPATGEIGELKLPFDAEDLAFDITGLVYLRTDNVVARFDPRTWQEIPFDYGEERTSVGFSSSGDGRRSDLVGAIIMPSRRPGCFHQGGMAVSPGGNLVVACYNTATKIDRNEQREIREAAEIPAGKAYTPSMFPGRKRYNEVHVWDRHGQLLFEDAAPGATMMDGIAIDKDNSLYMLVSPNRLHDGKPYFLERAETLIKVRSGRAKLASGKRGLPVPLAEQPARPAELARAPDGPMWIEGHEWLYGGVGFGGFNSSKGGGGCACWHARFALDHFARSFAPEVDHFSVAVLDSAGNLILRVGQYGNADSRGPESPVPLKGDGVGLFHAAYVATDTDRRLFIADGGNGRIVGVRLDYHRTERRPLAKLAAAK